MYHGYMFSKTPVVYIVWTQRHLLYVSNHHLSYKVYAYLPVSAHVMIDVTANRVKPLSDSICLCLVL